MSYAEFCSLLAGLMHDTPLGYVVSIRSEKDPKVIQKFNKDQKKIRNDWIIRRNRRLRENPEEYRKYWQGIQEWAKATFGKK